MLAATDCVIPRFEAGFTSKTGRSNQDTIADNVSCGLFVLGDKAVSPRKVDLMTCGMVVEKRSIISTGAKAPPRWAARSTALPGWPPLASPHPG